MVITKQVNLRDIINDRLSEYDIYRMYIGTDIKLNTMMKSPLRKDKHPSFSIGPSTSGRLVWRDYATDEKGGWTDLIGKMFNLSYPQVLQKVAKDWGLMAGTDTSERIQREYIQPVIEAKKTLIQVTTKKFTTEDVKWWGQYLISIDDLKKEEVYSVDSYYINRQKQILKPGEKVYCYYYGENGMKIYHPDRSRDEGRWKSSIPCSYVENIVALDTYDTIIIHKSKKDRLCAMAILPTVGHINVQNEGSSAFSEELVEKLMNHKVYLSYDADPAGKRNSIALTEKFQPWLKHVNVPDKYWIEDGIKDWSDLYKKYGREPMLKHFTDKGLLEKIG